MLKAYVSNYVAALRMICGLPVSRDHFRSNLFFIVGALILSVCTFAAFDYFQQDGVIFQSTWGTAWLGTFYFCGALIVIVVAFLEEDFFRLPILLSIVLSVLFWLAILISLFPFSWAQQNQSRWLSLSILFVSLFTVAQCIRVTFDYPKKRSYLIALGLTALFASIGWRQMYFPSVFDSYMPETELTEPQIDIENTFYQQAALMQQKFESISTHSLGQRDYFFLGVGGSDRQTVFETETKFAEQVIQDRFSSQGKSMILFNNNKLLDSQPIANRFNLRDALLHIGSKMDPNEDVLILLLTSHGSDNAELSIDLEHYPLLPIEAQQLRTYLDASGIRWRIIVISACYSGSFIDAISNDDTLLITAASADKNSFGCSSERELTFFGEAFFREGLANNRDWIGAYEHSRALITKWETENELSYSDPQIRIGTNIKQELNLRTPTDSFDVISTK